ncbi:hypothetical protein [Salininema proteolyticum]|uniref:Uncharacterized protein n=1 Tax=Salininema proteolyticum TaxID=1607685 RepID=A0ABV8U4P0_9ACTN
MALTTKKQVLWSAAAGVVVVGVAVAALVFIGHRGDDYTDRLVADLEQFRTDDDLFGYASAHALSPASLEATYYASATLNAVGHPLSPTLAAAVDASTADAENGLDEAWFAAQVRSLIDAPEHGQLSYTATDCPDAGCQLLNQAMEADLKVLAGTAIPPSLVDELVQGLAASDSPYQWARVLQTVERADQPVGLAPPDFTPPTGTGLASLMDSWGLTWLHHAGHVDTPVPGRPFSQEWEAMTNLEIYLNATGVQWSGQDMDTTAVADVVLARGDAASGLFADKAATIGSLRATYYAASIASTWDVAGDVIDADTRQAVREAVTRAENEEDALALAYAAATLDTIGSLDDALASKALGGLDTIVAGPLAPESLPVVVEAVNMARQLGEASPAVTLADLPPPDGPEALYYARLAIGIEPWTTEPPMDEATRTDVLAATNASIDDETLFDLPTREVAAAYQAGESADVPTTGKEGFTSWEQDVYTCDNASTLARSSRGVTDCDLPSTYVTLISGLNPHLQ